MLDSNGLNYGTLILSMFLESNEHFFLESIIFKFRLETNKNTTTGVSTRACLACIAIREAWTPALTARHLTKLY
jgi:hypothetical protein